MAGEIVGAIIVPVAEIDKLFEGQEPNPLPNDSERVTEVWADERVNKLGERILILRERLPGEVLAPEMRHVVQKKGPGNRTEIHWDKYDLTKGWYSQGSLGPQQDVLLEVPEDVPFIHAWPMQGQDWQRATDLFKEHQTLDKQTSGSEV